MTKINMILFRELLDLYEQEDLMFSEKLELRDKLQDFLDDIEKKIDEHYI
ncbi:hypothetical protein M2277_002667 [Paenibacillus sp. LBL]|nr:hypothetical protein [Paenibacillus sp. LBL]MDH6672005.1 hypothetical protein [Paenibacillus sp. LBL]